MSSPELFVGLLTYSITVYNFNGILQHHGIMSFSLFNIAVQQTFTELEGVSLCHLESYLYTDLPVNHYYVGKISSYLYAAHNTRSLELSN